MSDAAPQSDPLHQQPALKRDLGPRIAMAVVIGNVIGSGIFLKPGTIAGDGGTFGLIIAVWVFGGVLCLLGALCFAELATMLPRAGGMYVYLREAYGNLVAFLYGWTEVIFMKPASIGALVVAFVGALTLNVNAWLIPWGWRVAPLGEVALAIVVIAALAWVNVIGVLWGGRMQMLTTVIKAGFLGLVAVLPFLLIPFLTESVDLANYSSNVRPRAGLSLAGQVGAVLLAVMWAYNGWHGVTPLTEEVQRPQRNIPLALFGGVGILIVLYVAANFAYHGVMTMSEMSGAGEHAAELMLEKLLGPVGRAAMSAVIMCSTFGAINSNLLQAPRVSFAMGRDGVFFQSLGKVHANYRTPAPAIVVMAIMAILLVLAAAGAKQLVVGVNPAMLPSELAGKFVRGLQDNSIFTLLTNYVIFSASIFYVLTVLAVLVLRRTRATLKRPYRTWGYPLTPLLFVGVYAWFLTQVYRSQAVESLIGLLLIAGGVPIYFAYRQWRRRAGP